MARHRTNPFYRRVFRTSSFVALRESASRITGWWPWASTFQCSHCDVVQSAEAPTLAERRLAHALATDHSRHGFYAGAPVVYGA